MKKVTKGFLVGTVLLALVLSTVSAVSAQAPTAFYVGFQIQNLSATSSATVVVAYYNQDGTGASSDPTNYTQTIVIAASKSKTIICSLSADYSSDILAPAPAIRGATSFVGSVIISSDQPIVAIANEAASVDNPYGAASYDGISADGLADAVYAPMITQIIEPNTTINVQNPNSTAVNVTVQYIKGVYGTNYTAPAQSIPAYGSTIILVPAGALDGSGRFLGSAKVTSTGGKIAVVVDAIYAQSGVPKYNARQSYNAFAGGATKVVAPLVQKNDYGVWYTGLQVMNLGPGTATVRVTYSGIQGSGSDTSCVPVTAVSGLTEADFTLAENESRTILTEFGGALDSVALATYGCFRGAATMEVVGGTGKIAAIVSGAAQDRPSVAIYRAFDPALGTKTLNVPLIQKYLGGGGADIAWSTGIQVANVGSAAATVTGVFNVTCNGVSESITEATAAGAVAVGSSTTFLQNTGFPLGSLGTRVNCLGSAVFTSDQNIVAVVQEDFFGTPNPFTGDTFMAFEAFNQ